jgi:hypothetical protein
MTVKTAPGQSSKDSSLIQTVANGKEKEISANSRILLVFRCSPGSITSVKRWSERLLRLQKGAEALPRSSGVVCLLQTL